MPRRPQRIAPAKQYNFNPYARHIMSSSNHYSHHGHPHHSHANHYAQPQPISHGQNQLPHPSHHQSHHPSPENPSTGPSQAGPRPVSSWSTQDDSNLLHARQQGLNWQVIANRMFPGKTPNACRKRHERLMERSNADEWDGVKLELLATTYMEVRQAMWEIMGRKLGEKWTVVEAKCMSQGFKNLNAAARSANRRSIGTDDSGIGMDEAESNLDIGGPSASTATNTDAFSPHGLHITPHTSHSAHTTHGSHSVPTYPSPEQHPVYSVSGVEASHATYHPSPHGHASGDPYASGFAGSGYAGGLSTSLQQGRTYTSGPSIASLLAPSSMGGN